MVLNKTKPDSFNTGYQNSIIIKVIGSFPNLNSASPYTPDSITATLNSKLTHHVMFLYTISG